MGITVLNAVCIGVLVLSMYSLWRAGRERKREENLTRRTRTSAWELCGSVSILVAVVISLCTVHNPWLLVLLAVSGVSGVTLSIIHVLRLRRAWKFEKQLRGMGRGE